MNVIRLGNRIIDKTTPPYIIAEIGVNHEASLEKAKDLIEKAKEGGASAAKFQTYKADTLASVNSPAYWDLNSEKTRSQHELFQKYDSFEEKEYIALCEHCHKVGIDFISTPFDENAVDFLNSLVPFFKIASADLTNIPLLRKIASKQKPVVLSTGGSNQAEIDLAVSELHKYGCKDLCLLHCILNYPTISENANLEMIIGLQETYPDLVIGYSDHTLPDPRMLVLTAAYLKGAMVIEKHFTHNKNLPGNDHYHAMDMEDLKLFNQNIEILMKLRGAKTKVPLESENISRKNARRSIVLKEDVQAGQHLVERNLTCKRPGTGISPLYWDQILGKKTLKKLYSDHILQWNNIE